MTHTMEQKVAMIDDFISQLEIVIQNRDVEKANFLTKKVFAIFNSEIEDLKNGLSRFEYAADLDSLSDADVLIARLRNYKLNLATGLYKTLQGNSGAVNVVQSVNQDLEANFTVTLEETIHCIEEIPDNILSKDDKEVLNGKLASLSAMKEKDKTTKWEKAKEILKWIADKSVDVGIAALPYIWEIIKAG